MEFLGVNEVREYEKYLGLPAVVGRNKKESLNYIRERVWNKLQGWKERCTGVGLGVIGPWNLVL